MAPPLLPQTVTKVASDPNERAEASTLAEQAFVRLRFISLSFVDEARGTCSSGRDTRAPP